MENSNHTGSIDLRKNNVPTTEEVKNTIDTICGLFKVGTLKAFKIENHSLKEYKTALFQVEESGQTFEYIFKIQ